MTNKAMLFYDLDQGLWVRKPGSLSPPWMNPVLTLGSKFNLLVQFCEGEQLTTPSATSWMAVLNADGDFSANHLASSNAPYDNGEGAIIFTLDLTTSEASAYFTENPTASTQDCQFQIKFILDGDEKRTAPFKLTLQNDYVQA